MILSALLFLSVVTGLSCNIRKFVSRRFKGFSPDNTIESKYSLSGATSGTLT